MRFCTGSIAWLQDCFVMTLRAIRLKASDLPGKTIGSLAPRAKGGLVLAMDQGFYGFNSQSKKIETLIKPLEDKPHLRFNDGKVDPFGNFVAGAMNLDHKQFENAPMYRLRPDMTAELILDGFFCFNGPCFNEAGNLMYVTGREEGVIERFSYGQHQKP